VDRMNLSEKFPKEALSRQCTALGMAETVEDLETHDGTLRQNYERTIISI